MSISAAIGVINGLNECFSFAQSMSYLRSLWPAPPRAEILDLDNALRVLDDTRLVMRSLIDRAEWRFHKDTVPDLLRSLKNAFNDADDILDEFEYHKLKVEAEGNPTQCSIVDFFDTDIQGSFNKVKGIQERMNNISSQLEKMGLYQLTPGFDKAVRPVTKTLRKEQNEKIYGRDKELKEVMKLLGVSKRRAARKRKRAGNEVTASTNTSARNQFSNEPSAPVVPVLAGSEVTASTSTSANTSASNQLGNESSAPAVPVLVLVGMGGVGKTTLAQHICAQADDFDSVIWICADDFDVTRLIKDAIQSASRKHTPLDHLPSLQDALSDSVRDKRLLIVVDDVWDDALKEWMEFYAPLTTLAQGSMMVVTTRSQDVAHTVGTIKHKNHPEQEDTFYQLEGLKEVAFWDFFKLCAFGSESSNNHPKLEDIGRRGILPKLKGSPLAAKTLGRLLGEELSTSHWNDILESELWTLPQKETDILPALQLSYMYLPFHLKRCFSLCAVYPKDHKFKKGHLADIWVAEGYVEPQGDTPLENIGSRYFEDLLNRSFFQKVRGSYVIHDLLHDMAQRVSGHDCFIIKNMSDFQKVPQNVHHLYILPSTDLSHTCWSLRKHRKLRTLICEKSFGKQAAAIMKLWCSELLCLRVVLWASSNELPESIGDLKHLRHLELSKNCYFQNIPPAFCRLYNMQRLYAEKCRVKSLPSDFSKLISLQRLKLHGFEYYARREQLIQATHRHKIKLMKNLNQFVGKMNIQDLDSVSQDLIAELELKDKKNLWGLHLEWSLGCSSDNGATEVLQVLQPPTSLGSLLVKNYPDESLPNWFEPQNSAAVLDGMTCLKILSCQNLLSLAQLLQPAYVPHIRKLEILDCNHLASVPTERLGDLCSLRELMVDGCPNICRGTLMVPSLKKLKLVRSGILPVQIECCSLADFYLSCDSLTSIQLEKWTLPALELLYIISGTSLTSVGRSEGTGSNGAFASLTSLHIYDCQKVTTLDGLLVEDYLPAIVEIQVWKCGELLSLFGERSERFPSLNYLEVRDCPVLNWPRELVLPASLKRLFLVRCGDISAWFPRNLENLTFLVEMELIGCPCITSIPLSVCRINLVSLEKLCIVGCPDLVSIGGAKKAVAKIKELRVDDCPKMVELKQPMVRGYLYRFFDPRKRANSDIPPGRCF